MKTITAYVCDYCKKVLKTKRGAEKHESHFCYFNPDNKACPTCFHFVIEHKSVCDFGVQGCELELDYENGNDIEEGYSESPYRTFRRGCGSWRGYDYSQHETRILVVSRGGRVRIINHKFGEQLEEE